MEKLSLRCSELPLGHSLCDTVRIHTQGCLPLKFCLPNTMLPRQPHGPIITQTQVLSIPAAHCVPLHIIKFNWRILVPQPLALAAETPCCVPVMKPLVALSYPQLSRFPNNRPSCDWEKYSERLWACTDPFSISLCSSCSSFTGMHLGLRSLHTAFLHCSLVKEQLCYFK